MSHTLYPIIADSLEDTENFTVEDVLEIFQQTFEECFAKGPYDTAVIDPHKTTAENVLGLAQACVNFYSDYLNAAQKLHAK